MRLKKLYIDGFGLYHAREFETTAAVTVFHGPNEAGKSTFIEFIRTVLFGFPRQNDKDYTPPLAGGEHGGRLEIVSDDAKRYTFERYRGGRSRGTRFTVVNDTNQSVSDDVIETLRAHQSRDAFKEIHAFNLDHLAGLGTGDDISGRIYSAGTGAARLSGALKELGTRQDKLFTPGGKKQEIPKILFELEQLEKELRAVEKEAAHYTEKTRRRDELGDEIADAVTQQEQLQNVKHEKGLLKSLWPQWTELQELEGQLSKLPVYKQFPENPTPRLDALEQRVREATDRVQRLKQEKEKLKQRLAAQITGEELAEKDAGACKEIGNGLTDYRKSCAALEKQKANLDNNEQVLEDERAELGLVWTDDRVNQFDISIAVRDSIEQWKRKLEKFHSDCADLSRDTEKIESKTADSERKVEHATSKVLGHPCAHLVDTLDDDLSSLEKAIQACVAYEAVKTQFEDVTGSAISAVAVPTWQKVLGVVVIAGLGLVGARSGLDLSWTTVATYGAAIVFALIALYALSSRFMGGEDAVSHRVRNKVMETQSVYWKTLKPLEHHFTEPESVGMSALTQLERKLDELKTLKADLAVKTLDHDVDKKERDKITKQLDDKRTEHQAEKSAWEKWLKENAFPDVLTPEAALTLLTGVKQLRDHLGIFRDLRRRVNAIQKQIDAYERLVGSVAERHKHAVPSFEAEATDTVVMADRVQDVFTSATTAIANRRRSEEEAQERMAELEGAPAQLAGTVAERDSFIAKGGTTDPEEFRHRARVYQEREELERAVDAKKRELRAPWDGRYDDGTLSKMFSGTTKERIDREVENVTGQLGDIERSLDQKKEERGRVLNEIGQLEVDERASELRLTREALREELQDCAQEWAVVTMAKSLLDRARSKHEAERQPDVVKYAKKWFAQMTGQRYPNLFVEIGGDRTVVVEDNTGSRKTDVELSRGTREQLYLSLRFGLIQTLGQQNEKLPVIVDEVLVNSDKTRAAAAVDGFVELSKTNQVLVLTCHDWMVDLFNNATSDIEIVSLG